MTQHPIQSAYRDPDPPTHNPGREKIQAGPSSRKNRQAVVERNPAGRDPEPRNPVQVPRGEKTEQRL